MVADCQIRYLNITAVDGQVVRFHRSQAVAVSDAATVLHDTTPSKKLRFQAARPVQQYSTSRTVWWIVVSPWDQCEQR